MHYLSAPSEEEEYTEWGPWREPGEAVAKDLFLTAAGPGLPAFPAFEPYHRNVFSLYDNLLDTAEYYPNWKNDVSYQVVGWYSDPARDVLARPGDIPGVPAGALPGEVLAALGWKAEGLGEGDTLGRSLYCGTALGMKWDAHHDLFPPSEIPPSLWEGMKVAVGHSTAEVTGELTSRQTSDALTGELVQALFQGTIDTFGTAVGEEQFEEATRRAWYVGEDGGYVWQIVRRGEDDTAPVPPPPAWLEELNTAQQEYDALAPQLERARWRLWSLWWLSHQPAYKDRPADFNTNAARQINPAIQGTLAHRTAAMLARSEALLEYLPHGTSPEGLQEAIEVFAGRQTPPLPAALELKRVARDVFFRAADPVVMMTNTGSIEPLGRDEEDPLPCRTPAELVTRMKIGNTWTNPQYLAPPDLGDVPAPATVQKLLKEFFLLDKAAFTNNGTALTTALATPGAYFEGGAPAEYTGLWEQPWTPMYLQWELDYCPLPFRTGTTGHWSFDGTDYQWNGTGTPPANAEPGDNPEGNVLWRRFEGRCFLTPTAPWVLREQVKRYLQTYGDTEAGELASLLAQYSNPDLEETLSQSLDGFSDWLLVRDSSGRRVPAPAELAPLTPGLTGDPATVPFPDEPYKPGDLGRFQAVRAGQFYFRDLRIIDRFGRVCDRTNTSAPEGGNPNYDNLKLVTTPTTTPGRPLYPNLQFPQRFVQLPPRLLQGARCRFEAVRASDNTAFTTPAPVPDDPRDTPLAGWLLLNYLDKNLLVYAPDGSPLGELRTVADGTRVAYSPLPHSRYTSPAGFAGDYPDLAQLLTHLTTTLGREGPAAFERLMATIDQSLDHVEDSSAQDDGLPARIIGHPVALIRATVNIDLKGPPLPNPSWNTALNEPDESYLDYTWPIRLGESIRPDDGLIGYYSSTNGPDRPISYTTFHALQPATTNTSPYVQPARYETTAGAPAPDLTLPARPTDRDPVTHHVTLLADPHAPIHATTGILPIASLTLDTDLVHQSLDRIRASFRLDPLLAPARTAPREVSISTNPALGTWDPATHPLTDLADDNLSTYWLSKEHAKNGAWVMIDLGEPQTVSRIDIYPGAPTGQWTAPAGTLEHTLDTNSNWQPLTTTDSGAKEIHYPQPNIPFTPFTTRYIRLRLTADQEFRMALRSFTVTTTTGDNGIVMPRPAAWWGDWSWAEPHTPGATAADPPVWGETPVFPADLLTHPDEAPPTARAGYLQLTGSPTPTPRILTPAEGSTYPGLQPVLTGTGIPGATVTLTRTTDPAHHLDQAIVGPDGTWTLTPQEQLPAGTITFAVTQTLHGIASQPATRTLTTQPPQPPLTYGDMAYLQNGADNWDGGYLDTNGNAENITGARYLVSTARIPTRHDGTGTWQILNNAGQDTGQPVLPGDVITLRNQYSERTYLDTNGGATADQKDAHGKYRVTTTRTIAERPSTVTWTILAPGAPAEGIRYGDTINLRNNYGPGGSYLATNGPGTGGRKHAVCTNDILNHIQGDTDWRFLITQPPAPEILTPRDQAKLTGLHVTLTGTAENASEVRLYEAGHLLATVPVTGTTWSADLTWDTPATHTIEAAAVSTSKTLAESPRATVTFTTGLPQANVAPGRHLMLSPCTPWSYPAVVMTNTGTTPIDSQTVTVTLPDGMHFASTLLRTQHGEGDGSGQETEHTGGELSADGKTCTWTDIPISLPPGHPARWIILYAETTVDKTAPLGTADVTFTLGNPAFATCQTPVTINNPTASTEPGKHLFLPPGTPWAYPGAVLINTGQVWIGCQTVTVTAPPGMRFTSNILRRENGRTGLETTHTATLSDDQRTLTCPDLPLDLDPARPETSTPAQWLIIYAETAVNDNATPGDTEVNFTFGTPPFATTHNPITITPA
ncbi:discoidin domain-containing protein [Streptomyces sp. NPDC020799]|uniref:discoidin domain-containing protein n=1 Tax=Streptomyces sp. NPDC020799 TaxID=3365091 RepID=UPI0037917199